MNRPDDEAELEDDEGFGYDDWKHSFIYVVAFSILKILPLIYQPDRKDFSLFFICCKFQTEIFGK